MGVGLSCLGESKTQEKLTSSKVKPAVSSDQDGTCSFLAIFKSGAGGCFHSSSGKHHHPQPHPQEEMKKIMLRSLGDWLSESTSSTTSSVESSFMFMSFSKKVHPSSSVHPIRRGSFSSKEKLLKDHDQQVLDGEDLHVAPSFSQSQKGKAKKKVSFRLPEDNEIIIFSSPAFQEEAKTNDST